MPHRLWTDPDVRRYLWDDVVIPRELAEDIIRDSAAAFRARGLGLWLVSLRNDPEPIGFAGLREFGEPPDVEVLVGLYPAYWRRGFGAEASRAILRWGFDQCGLERIYGGADAPNRASIRLMDRVGMRPAGTRRLAGLEGPVEALYYAIDRADLGASSEPLQVFDVVSTDTA